MPNINPISDLRNYNTVLSRVADGQPVYLTRNGHGAYAVYTMEEADELEKDRVSLRTMLELNRGMESGEQEGWLTPDEVKTHLIGRRQERKN